MREQLGERVLRRELRRDVVPGKMLELCVAVLHWRESTDASRLVWHARLTFVASRYIDLGEHMGSRDGSSSPSVETEESPCDRKGANATRRVYA